MIIDTLQKTLVMLIEIIHAIIPSVSENLFILQLRASRQYCSIFEVIES